MDTVQHGYVMMKGQQLHYLSMGSGSRLLVAFHGYGNDAALFIPFAKYLAQQYTIISIDLPYHGKGNWLSKEPLVPQDFATMLQTLMQQEGAKDVSLLGYSMGGRICLCLLQTVPHLISKALLIAPDGLVFNPFYYFAMRTSIGKTIFTYVLQHPKYFLGLLTFLKNIKLLDVSRYKFLTRHMQSDEARRFLLNVWPVMRKIIPTSRKVKAAIHQNNIPVSIYMGAYDRIIIPRYATQFSKGLPSVQVHVLQKGHHLFDDESVATMANNLLLLS